VKFTLFFDGESTNIKVDKIPTRISLVPKVGEPIIYNKQHKMNIWEIRAVPLVEEGGKP